jgi:hypothetical protein
VYRQQQRQSNLTAHERQEKMSLAGMNVFTGLAGNFVPFPDFGIFSTALSLIGSAAIVGAYEHRELTPTEACSIVIGGFIPIIGGFFANPLCEKMHEGMEICDGSPYYLQPEAELPTGRDLYKYAQYQKFRKDNDCDIIDARRRRAAIAHRHAVVRQHGSPRVMVTPVQHVARTQTPERRQ